MKALLIAIAGFAILLTPGEAQSQHSPIEITNKTFKLGINEELMYFGFEEGDEILFNFELVDGKAVKEIEITELPGSSKFMDWKTTKITDQKIKVQKRGIYLFRFRNGGIGRKICRVNIQRIPASEETVNFNSATVWKTRYDTTMVDKVKIELANVDTISVEVMDRTERVHSKTNIDNSNISKFGVNLPKNEKTPLQTKKVISWAWWVGVGNAGTSAYNQAKKDFMLKNAAKVGTLINPLAGLALGAYAIVLNPPEGDNIHYWMIAHYQDGSEYRIGSGNSVIAFGREEKLLQGGFSVTLQNDNWADGINVNVKITAVQEIRTFKKVHYQEPQIESSQYIDFAD